MKWETGIAMATKPGEGKVAEREESRHSMKQNVRTGVPEGRPGLQMGSV